MWSPVGPPGRPGPVTGTAPGVLTCGKFVVYYGKLSWKGNAATWKKKGEKDFFEKEKGKKIFLVAATKDDGTMHGILRGGNCRIDRFNTESWWDCRRTVLLGLGWVYLENDDGRGPM